MADRKLEPDELFFGKGLSALALNTDWTNRKESVKGPKLLPEVKKFVENASHDFVTFSELQSKKLGNDLSNVIDMPCFVDKVGYDFISTCWDSDHWTVVVDDDGAQVSIFSNVAKYQLVTLESKTNHKLLYGSVHFPTQKYPKLRAQAFEFLEIAVEKYSPDVDAVLFGGDWNASPDYLNKNAQFLQVALSEESGPTTENGGMDDNFGTTNDWKTPFGNAEIVSAYKHLTHFPVRSLIFFEK